LNSPRMPEGASGLGSKVSCWGGPPSRNSTMHDLALPNEPDGVASFWAANWDGIDRPKADRPPRRSHSRRVRPWHRRGPASRRLIMAGPRAGGGQRQAEAGYWEVYQTGGGPTKRKRGRGGCAP